MQDVHDARIMLVDDEPELVAMIEMLLQQSGFTKIESANTVASALSNIRLKKPDIVVLDVMLPDGDGFDLFQKLRQFSKVPVLFLSARDEDETRLWGLGLGADDYITKPFLPQELTLRLSAVLRRTYAIANTEEKSLIILENVSVNMNTGIVTGNGEEKALTAKEYALLEKLNEDRGRIVTIDSLCMAAWNEQNFGYENTLMVHMRRLREKIESDPSHPQFLINVRGLGYRLLREAKKE
jgi:DNA-binding response OmpR family regulator